MIFGFGGKKRFYFQAFDRGLRDAGVHPALVEDAMRLAVYRWVMDRLPAPGRDPGLFHQEEMEAAGRFAAFVLIGPGEIVAQGAGARLGELEARFDTVLDAPDHDTVDARLVRLIVSLDRAADDIASRIEIEVDE